MTTDLSIKHRLVLGFSCVLGLMGLVAFLTGGQFAETRRAGEVITNDLIRRVAAANSLAMAVDRQVTALQEYALTGEKKFFDEYRLAVSDERSAFSELRERLTDRREVALLADIESQLARLHQDESRVIALPNGAGRDVAWRYHQERIHSSAEKVTDISGRIASHGLDSINKATGEFTYAMDRLANGALASLAVAVLLALMFIVATVRSVTRPARSIALAAEAVTRGDYDRAIALERDYGRRRADGGMPKPQSELRQIAVAVGNMARTLERRERALEAHADVSAVCASTIELEFLLDSALAELARHTHSQVAAVYLSGSGGLSARGTFGMSPETADIALTGPEGLVHQAVKSGKPIIVSDVPDDTGFLIQPGLGKAVPASIACVPMVVEGKSLGAVVLASLHEYDQEARALMEAAVAQIGVAISNALRHQNVKGLANELRAMNEQLDARNEELRCQNEEIQAQSEELSAQRAELLERNQELETLTKDLTALQTVTAVALSSLDQEELLAHLLEAVTEALGLQCGLVALLDEDGQTLRTAVRHNIPTGDQAVPELHVGEGFAGKVAESRKILSISDAQKDPLVDPDVKNAGVRALVGVPLGIGEPLYGVALLGSSEPRKFSSHEKQLLRFFGDRARVAIERARAYERIKAAEAKARFDRERLQTIIDNMPEAVVIAAAPSGRIYMANKLAMSLYGLDALPSAEIPQHAEAYHLYRPNGDPIPGEELPLSKSLLRGETCSGEEVLIRQPDGKEVIVLCNTVPMRDDEGDITGAIGVFQDISAIKEQQRLLQEVYEHQRGIAETLQKSFLPSTRPKVAGYEIADAYIAAQEHAQVGGDFYDIIELGDGMLGLVIGDVSGKGVEAAVHTAMAKYMLRGFAHEDHEPSVVLTRLNDAMARYVHGEVFITLFYGVLYTHEKKLVYANGGHEHPLLYRSRTGDFVALECTGPAVGVIPDCEYTQTEVHLAEGDAFVLYTDGITEARRDKEFLGYEGLKTMLAHIETTSAREMTNQILARVQDYADGKLQDDIALLVVKLDKPE